MELKHDQDRRLGPVQFRPVSNVSLAPRMGGSVRRGPTRPARTLATLKRRDFGSNVSRRRVVEGPRDRVPKRFARQRSVERLSAVRKAVSAREGRTV